MSARLVSYSVWWCTLWTYIVTNRVLSLKYFLKLSLTIERNRYTQNGILMMLDRNRRIKACPERFQEINGEKFDVVFTVEERIYDAVLEGNIR